MLVGVNMVGLKPYFGGGPEIYLRNVLDTAREVQPDTRFLILTTMENHASFEGYDRRCLDKETPEAAGEAAAEASCDVLFSSLYTAPEKSPVPLVAYAFELYTFEQAGAQKRLFGEHARVKELKQICKDARAIIVPSEFLRREFLERLDVPLNQCVVAPPGVSDIFAESHPTFVQNPYVLFVGNTHTMKNLPRLLEAYRKVNETHPHTLVVVGQPGDAELEDWGPGIVRIERCSTAHLSGLYQHSNLFILPSVYEGSGVTVLEAMKAGARVATSRRGGIKEVAGDIPIFFNAEDVSSIVGAIRRGLTEDPAERERQIRFGRQIAAEYTWEKCAWKTLAAFKR